MNLLSLLKILQKMPSNNFIKIQDKQFKVLYLTTLVLLLPLFASVFFLYNESTKQPEVILEPESIEVTQVDLNKVNTAAYSAIVVSLNTGAILYQKNQDLPLPLASLTKLVTIKVAENQSTGENVSIKKGTEFPEYGDIQLSEDAVWDIHDLSNYTLITSSNDGAHSLLKNSKNSFSFTKNMNTFTASIGLVNTHFYNETGLDNDDTGILGSKGTAKDVSKILSYLVKNNLSLYEKTKYATVTIPTPEGVREVANTNEVANQITGLLVSKTGYTDSAGGNLAIVADMGLNEPTAFVVLKSSKEARFEDILKLQKEYFTQVRERMR